MSSAAKIIINTEEQTTKFADEFFKTLKGGEFIALIGNLGAGKTFFVKQLLKNIGIENVSSPTFSLVNIYEGRPFSAAHFDFYRINKPIELFDIGFYEYLDNPELIVLAEWADMFHEVLPDNRIELKFNIVSENEREIEVKYYE
ncbi:MAG TPA: tRNA (adenosine(37)-N6)-threonylcarbamoyltransferase complex ATPase subunit type 1 TsaE [Ignavibacteriales bacterium]|nr:tRNA (adenosine(37)-N6)-threonylcarbamoyltransferase complex ATPase subunit type 1 TsaE [Ignavibacteriales bacterium]